MAFDVSLYEQAALFVYALIVGVFVGIVYDVFRIVRIALTGGRGSNSKVRFERVENLITGIRGQRVTVKRPGIYKVGRRLEYSVVFVCDVLFFLVTAVVSVVFLYQANYGQPRLYVAVSAIIGFAVYYNTVGRMVALSAGAVISLFRLIWTFFVYRLVAPLVKATYKAISVPFETLERRLLLACSSSAEDRLSSLPENLYGYLKKENKKEDENENRRYSKNCNGNSCFILHRKNRQPENRVFRPESSAGNDSGKDRLLHGRGG